MNVESTMVPGSTFDISLDGEATRTLVVGLSHLGMAGVTAADYLVRQLESTQIGHVAPQELPAITPFEEGLPRHHSRLYAIEDTSLTILVSELFIPVGFARSFADELLSLVDEAAVEEIVVLHGVPFPHGPDDHDIFYVANEAYRGARLENQSIRPLQGGFLDGVVGEIALRSLHERAPGTGVLITPTHPPGPDIDAALQLITGLETLYDLGVDESELRKVGKEQREHYEQLAERLSSMAEEERALRSHDYPEDRMFM